MTNSLYLVLAALLVGAMIPFQLAFNAQLGVAMKSPYTAGLVIFVVGALAMLIMIAVMKQPLPAANAIVNAPSTAWLGGVLASFYILAVVIVTPKLGVGTTVVLVISGQILFALVLEHFGAFGSMQHTFSWSRALGAVLVIAGVFAIRAH